jgi:hypothetical protein
MAGLPPRRADRVIVLDPGDRVLLLCYGDDPPAGWRWANPGGACMSVSSWPGPTGCAASSRTWPRCTLVIASPYGDGGHRPNWTPRQRPGLTGTLAPPVDPVAHLYRALHALSGIMLVIAIAIAVLGCSCCRVMLGWAYGLG